MAQEFGITSYAEKMYSVNFTATKKKFCLSLHYNGDNSYLFDNRREIIKFKAKDSSIVAIPICRGNVFVDVPPFVNKIKKIGLCGSVFDFIDDILDIHILVSMH